MAVRSRRLPNLPSGSAGPGCRSAFLFFSVLEQLNFHVIKYDLFICFGFLQYFFLQTEVWKATYNVSLGIFVRGSGSEGSVSSVISNRRGFRPVHETSKDGNLTDEAVMQSCWLRRSGVQMSSFFVMMVVMVTMLSLGTYLQPLPKSVLGALIAVNLKNSLKQLADPFYLWSKSKLDCCVWVVSFLSTFILGLPYGVAVGVGFSVLVVIFNTQFRNGSALGQISSTDLYKNPKVYSKVQSIDGIKIVNYCSPLYFANSEIFRQKVIKKTGLDPNKAYLAKKKYLKKHEKEEERRQRGSVFMKSKTLSLQELQEDFDGAFSTDSNNNSTVNGTNSAISYIASNTLTVNSQITTPIPNGMSAKTEDPILTAPPIVNFHTIIIDMSAVCFVDLMGIKALGKLCSSYQRIGVNFYLADVQAQVYDDIEQGGVFVEGGLNRDHIFLTVHDAVLYALANDIGAKHEAYLKEGSGDTEICVQDTQDEINEDYPNLEEAMFGSMFQTEIQTAL